MRLVWLVFLGCCGSLVATEAPRAFPLWDGKETVESYAARVNMPPTKSIDLGGGVALDLVLIPAGQFMMGSREPPPPAISWRWAGVIGTFGLILVAALLCVPLVNWIKVRKFSFSLRVLLLFTMSCGLCIGGAVRFHLGKEQEARYNAARALYEKLPADEKPAHLETIAEPFYMGKYTVTQDQYEIIAGYNPSFHKGAQFPVECVNQRNSVDYCAKLTDAIKARLDREAQIRLPSEPEWEFACRAGTASAFNTGETISTDEANFDGLKISPYLRGVGIQRDHTTRVGSFKPNAFGLFDMHGNVYQLCLPPALPNAFDSFAYRGACFGNSANECRSAFHYTAHQEIRSAGFGFRVILTVPTPAQ
ncbi:MAG TPA: formylglycine-generating enzyme family protein [Planctomycetota bacterium]|nr:formylglycine-generating enzyme family protein [Planctomycetota bacterium]